MALQERSATQGLPTWVWALAALCRLERDEEATAAKKTGPDGVREVGFATSRVLRTALELSKWASTVNSNHLRQVLETLAQALCVECERDDDGLLSWHLTQKGRDRLQTLIDQVDEMRAILTPPKKGQTKCP